MYSSVTLAIAIGCAMAMAVIAWPSGAPESVCDSLNPSHGNNRAKTSNAPFALTQSSDVFQPGERVRGMIKTFTTSDENTYTLAD